MPLYPPSVGGTGTSITSEVDVANTTTPATLISLTLLTGSIQAGNTWLIDVAGTVQVTSTSGTLVFQPSVAGVNTNQTVTMGSQGSSGGPAGFWLQAVVTVRTNGASGTLVATGRGEIELSSRVNLSSGTTITTAAVDTTVASPVVALTATWATQNAANSLKVVTGTIRQVA